VSIVRQEISETATYTGRIRTEIETRHPFRIAGWMIERSANVGDRIAPGQVVAKLEPQDELNALRFAQADIAVAKSFS
jgi:multidrug efflux pump subunit AcrA (membrane-fusion protein)